MREATLVFRPDAGDRCTLALAFWEALASGLAPRMLFAAPNARRQWLAQLVEQANWECGDKPVVELLPGGATALLLPHSEEADALVGINDGVLVAMRKWVADVLVGMRICPFTESPDVAAVGIAGVPSAAVLWKVSGANGRAAALAEFWRVARDLATASNEELSAAMLVLPAYDEDYARFYTLGRLVEGALVASGGFQEIQAVVFHPTYTTPQRLEYGHHHPASLMREEYERAYGRDALKPSVATAQKAADFSRRTPHACINLLRSDQVQSAENTAGGSWRIYAANLRRLSRSSSIHCG